MDSIRKTKKNNKQNKVKYSKPYSLKGTMSHLRGLPPSPHWANKFSSFIFDRNLLYLSNTYIVNIDLDKKEFYQLINSNNIDQHLEKMSVICKINSEFFIVVTNKLNFLIFQKYSNTSNLEDTRVYFREVKKAFRFPELDSTSMLFLKKSSLKESSFAIKTIKNLEDKQIMILSDNEGNIHFIKYIFNSKLQIEDIFVPELKYLYGCNVTGDVLSSFITDIVYLHHNNIKDSLLIFSTTKGDLLTFSLIDEHLVKINKEPLKTGCKEIYSLDCLSIGDFALLSGVDKNGSLFAFSLQFNEIKYNLILFEKNKFNNKSIEERYLFFMVKLVLVDSDENKSNVKLIVTSNKGRIYNTMMVINFPCENISYNFKEVTDNPHSFVIFNILTFNDKLLFISADNSISFFKSKEMLFESDIKTVGSLPKFIHFNSASKSLFLLNESNQMLQYTFTRKLNGLSTTARNNLFANKKKIQSENKMVLLSKQANFNEYIFAFLLNNSLVIYNYLADVRINKLNYGEKIVDLVFYSCKREYKDNLISNNDKFEEIDKSFKDESVIKTIKEMFTNSKEYDLMFILDIKGIVTVWDYIYNKINKFKICSEGIESAFLFPADENILFSLILNNKNEISFNVCVNQLVSNEIFSMKREPHTEDFICDYFINENNKDVLLFIIENSTSVKLIHFSELLAKINTSLASATNSLNYSEYVKTYESIKEFKNLVNNNIIVTNISNMPIKNLQVYKSNINNNQTNNNLIKFMISQSDNVIKIFELEIDSNNHNQNYKIKLKYSINAHLNRIINLLWVDQDSLVSISQDHTLKLWNILMCKPIDLTVGEHTHTKLNTNADVNFNNTLCQDNKIIIKSITNNINKLNSLCLYQQSFKSSQDFLNIFNKFYENLKNTENCDLNNENYTENTIDLINSILGLENGFFSNPDILIFSLFKNQEANFIVGEKIVNFEINNIIEHTSSKNLNKFLPNLINLLLYSKYFNIKIKDEENLLKLLNKKLTDSDNKLQINYSQIIEILDNFSNLDFLEEKYSSIIPTKLFEQILHNNFSTAIEILLYNNLHIEALTIYKLRKLSTPQLFITILEKLRTFIYPKQTFQSVKVQKVIEAISSYLNK